MSDNKKPNVVDLRVEVSVCYDLTVVYECIVGVSEEEWLALPDEQREERFSDLVSEVAEKLYYDHDEPSACEDEDSLLMRIDIYYDDTHVHEETVWLDRQAYADAEKVEQQRMIEEECLDVLSRVRDDLYCEIEGPFKE
jgi:hypothetical protein